MFVDRRLPHRNLSPKPQQSSMADDTPRDLQCLIKGEPVAFRVELKGSKNIIELKDLIKQEGMNGVLKFVDAKDLILWKVRMTFLVIRSDITGDTTLAYGGYPYLTF